MPADRIAARFELLERVGEDLLAEEFRAVDLSENRRVSVKLLKPDACRRSAENLFRFRRLLRELMSVKHAAVCHVLAEGEWKERHYVAYDCPELPRLSERGVALSVEETLSVMEDVARGLEAAHARGILHGLLNCDSVLLDSDGPGAKLRDFGAGLLLDLTQVREKADVRRIFGYLSPEQSGILRKPADARSDLYSMGILFYELLGGAPPYVSEEVNVLISEHISRAPAPLRPRNANVPETLERIVFKLIAKDPEDRYQTIGGVIADLEEFQKRRAAGNAEPFEIGLQDRVRKPSFTTRLVGRDAELNRLRSAVQQAKAGHGSILFIHGEPGIGKTRLINELRADVHALGGMFIGGKCAQYNAGSPFNVVSMAVESFIERLRRLSAEEQKSHAARIAEAVGDLGGEIVKLTPRIREVIGDPPTLAPLEPEQLRTRFMVTAVNFLASLGAREQPLVIFLEDLQWSDEGSCELLERLAVKLDGRSLTLIVSYRDTEVDSSHPVSRLKEVLKSGEIGFDDIQVKAFELEQTKEIVSRVLLEPPERVERLADYLRGRTHGNPFFILELLRTMVEEGVVRYENGRCHFDAAELERVNLPDNIVEAVLRRMRDLPEADLQVLSFAAVIGKQVELGLLSALTNRQTEDLLGSIDRAIEHQVLARDIAEEDSVSFVHDRVREAFYSRVNDVGVLHRQIAEALEVQNPKASGSVVYDLAYHFSQGNVSQKALDYSLQAAEMAAQSTAHDLAIDLFEKARLIFESERMTRDERYMGLLEQLGESYRISGHYDDAIRTLQRCEHLVRRHHAAHSSPEGASPKGSPQRGSSDIARVLAKMSDAYFEKGEATKAATLIERALKGLGLEIPQNRVVIMVGAAWQLFKHLAHMLRPRRWSRRFAHLTEREATIARMMARLTYIYYFNDMEKTFYCAMLNTNFLENHYPSRQLASQYGLGGPLWISMPWFWKAKWDLDRCMELAREFQDTHAEARCYSYLSFRARTMNRPREGLEYCAKGIRMLRKIGEFYDLGVGYVFREHCNSLMTPSSQAIDENKEFVQMSRDGHLDQVLSWALMFSGYYVTLRGEISEAVLEDVRESAEMGLRLNDRPSALLGLAILARGYLRRKDYTNALATVRRIEGFLPTHQLKAPWIKEVWPICAQVYLEAIQHIPNLSRETREEYFKGARRFCKDSLKVAKSYQYIYGWSCQVNGTYRWLRGEKKSARRFWEKGIRFLRQTDGPYQLAFLEKEAGRWLLQENRNDRTALEYLSEAKDLFARHDCFKDATETAALIHGSTPDAAVEPTRGALTFKRHLESLLSITQAIGSVFDLEELLQQVVDYAMEVTGAERGCILLQSSERAPLDLRVGRGWDAGVSERAFSYETYGISLGFVEDVRKRQEARIAASKDADEIGAELTSYGVRQAMAVPLRTKEKDLGILYLDNHLADGVFGDEELALMKSFAIQAAVSIENTGLVQSLVEQDRLKQEMKLGHEIQQGFLPKEPPKVHGLEVAAFMEPAREIGGDYYDFILRPVCARDPDERLSDLSAHPERAGGESKGLSAPSGNGDRPLAIVVGDVTGKGLGAGLNMAMVKTTLLTLSQEAVGLKEILAKANRILHGQMTFGTFITLLYMQWDPAARVMSVAGAGHCEILVYRRGTRTVEGVRCGGTALGLIPEIESKLEERPLNLLPGDKVILYTDGVIEALNAAEEEYGMDRLTASVLRHGDETPQQVVESLRKDVQAFIGEAPQYDDITVITAQVSP